MPGAASDVLGFGDRLLDQVRDETEEQRRRRLLEMQQKKIAPISSALGVDPGAMTGLLGFGA